MENIVVITNEDDKEAIEAIKKTVGEKAVEVLVVPKSPDEESPKQKEFLAVLPEGFEEQSIESIKLKIHAATKPPFIFLLAGALLGNYGRNLPDVLNDPDIEEKLAKSLEELNKKFEVRKLPRILDGVDTKKLIDDTPFYDEFLKKGKRSNNNHWGDKSKFIKKGKGKLY